MFVYIAHKLMFNTGVCIWSVEFGTNENILYCVLDRYLFIIFIVRNSSWGKVMFSQACVKNSVHRGVVYTSPLGRHPPWTDLPWVDTPQADTALWADTSPGQALPLGRHPPGQKLPPSWDGPYNGRYASYWNAFLFSLCMLSNTSTETCRRTLMWSEIFCHHFEIFDKQIVLQ